MNIFTKLSELSNLTENEKILVNYIKNNPEDFINLPAPKIAYMSYVSISTIYRLCKKVNVSGLSELKVQVSLYYHNEYLKKNNKVDYDYPFNPHETQNQITLKMKELYEQTLVSSLNLMDLDQIKIIVEALSRYRYIDFYTSAGNIYFAENFKFQMQEIGTFINVPIEEYHQLLTASTSNKDHIAIVMSFGGRGIIIEKLISALRSNKTKIILISSTGENNISKYADYQLYLSSNENHYNKISSFSTRLSLLYLLDCIYTNYFNLNYEKNLNFKLNSYERMTKSSK